MNTISNLKLSFKYCFRGNSKVTKLFVISASGFEMEASPAQYAEYNAAIRARNTVVRADNAEVRAKIADTMNNATSPAEIRDAVISLFAGAAK